LVGTNAPLVAANLGWRPVPTKVGTYRSVGGCQPWVGIDAAPGSRQPWLAPRADQGRHLPKRWWVSGTVLPG